MVFPFVPVTWITGTDGIGDRGLGTGFGRREPARRPRRSADAGERRSTAPIAHAVSAASASAASRRRQGKATTIWSGAGPRRARTASRRAPEASAIGASEPARDARHGTAALLGPGRPGGWRAHGRGARRSARTRSSPRRASSRGPTSVSLIAGRGK